jgi:hypothetical protein
MTYTFKLARRLAVSRTFTMLPVLLVLASCGGDATAPEGTPGEPPSSGTEWRPRDITPVEVSVSPSRVTLETNQLIKFRAHGRTRAGDSVGAAITWSTSGGTILPDGRFSAAAIGTYTVLGVTRVRGNLEVDTSLVTVVRRQSQLVSVEVTPTSVSLTPGLTQTFTALGRLQGGSPVPIGVNWSATGGSIDAGGTYTAGDTAGTYRVIATNTAGTLADTVAVTITAPPTPPPPGPTPPPTSGAVKLILMPHAATLAPGTTRQFAAFGRTATGDSVAVTVTFKATGGTVNASGLFTAGSTPGNYRIIATEGTLADTSGITVTQPLGSGTIGVPFGPFRVWNNLTLRPNTAVFSLTMGTEQPWTIVERLNYARSRGVKMMINMTGGAHQNYLTDGVFDMAKWKAKLNTFNTATIRTAVADAVADGTLIGNSVLDEPHHYGLGDPNNSWGPKGTFTKARVDSMCADVKAIFPSLPAGVFHDHSAFEPDKSYRVCDFIVDQYAWRKGDVAKFRDDGLALARRDGHAIAFSLNIIDGGIQAPRDGLWNCPATSGGRGTYEPNCRMTAQQVRDWGIVLGSAGCALTMWWYDDAFMADLANQQAFKDVADRLATVSNKGCRRPS